jgi:hypothetical protein
VALVYVNRSGSTLLSRLISERFGDVHVFPELAFPLQMLSGPPQADLGDLVAGDPRSEAIGLDGHTLREICARHAPASAAAFLADLATAARGWRAPATIVFKLESLLYVHRELATAFPGLGMIHIVRDPRAVANSMLRTPVPEKPGFDMARGSAVFAARHWRDYQRLAAKVAGSLPMTTIRYEELESDPEGILGGLAEPLGVANAEPSVAAPYRVAALDAALHPNIFRPFQPGRLEAWRTELPRGASAVIESICATEMDQLGYRRDHAPMPAASPAMLAAQARHMGAMLVHNGRSVAAYARTPGGAARLRQRLGLALTRASRTR